MNKIYENESYIREIKTVVAEAGTDAKGRFYAVFEDTVFFPEEGGQYADTGTVTVISDGNDSAADEPKVRVLDGIISKGEIRYIISGPLEAGMNVSLSLDWDQRYDRMQNHSGEHILTGVIHNRYGFDNVGFHLSDTGFVTIDFNGTLGYEQVIECEEEANRVIYANMPIKDSYPTAEELAGIEYRSKKEIDGQVRLITIGDEERLVDICACCAPHVKRTGEVGIIKVLSVINWKGGIRISFLCGRRALLHINSEHDILMQTARSLSTEAVNIPAAVNRYREEASELKAAYTALREKTVTDAVKAAGEGGIRCVFVEGDFPAVSMKNIYNVLREERSGYVGIFAGDDESGYRYNAGGEDSRELAAKMKEKFGAKGGGSADMIQGRVDALREQIERFFDEEV